MPTRNVVLTDHQANLVKGLVSSGRYQNASEVLREGLRLIEARDAEEQVRLEALRVAIQVGIDDIEAGHSQLFQSPDALRTHLESIAKSAVEKGLRRTGQQ